MNSMITSNNQYPKEWYCPITHDIMIVPVMADDGITYEKDAIEKWLSNNTKSPITGKSISKNSLTVNYALKNTIEQIVFNKSQSVIDSSHWTKSKSNIAISTSKVNYNKKKYLHIKIDTPNKGEAKDTLLLSLVDVSGSMGNEASTNENEGGYHGFSRLDLVKHSLKTIIESSNDKVEIGLIPFSESAQVLMHPTKMIPTEKSKASDLVDTLTATNTTNIWDALRLALEISKKPIHSNKNIFILLFTDGVPNINPPRGIKETLKRDLDSFSLNGTINTFGFGYGLDSDLLRDISDIGLGSYSFIPDATMVGTVFVNFIANALLTLSANHVLQVRGEEIGLGFCVDINIGTLQYGQSRDFIIPVPDTDLKINFGEISNTILRSEESIGDFEEFSWQYCRKKIIEVIFEINKINKNPSHKTISESEDMVNDLYQCLYEHFSGSENICELLKDLKSTSDSEGQILKAVSRLEWYNKWGKHYLLSIQNAHMLQQCNNFKDKGVQLYGGKGFVALRDEIEDIFCKIPPPKPSALTDNYVNAYVAPTSMAAYMDADGGCFNGDANIKMEDGKCKRVSELVKNDLVFGGFKVKCVVKTKIMGKLEMVNINSLLITPWHPILSWSNNEGEWKFPIKELFSTLVDIDYIYNIVLEMGHIVILNGISVVTLGHGFTDNDVIKHDYYGTEKVIEDLKKLDGWEAGLVNLNQLLVTRGPGGNVTSMSTR